MCHIKESMIKKMVSVKLLNCFIHKYLIKYLNIIIFINVQKFAVFWKFLDLHFQSC